MGPYYAMFPVAFADDVVRTYTCVGDTVLDPFAGRGTAVFSAAALSRSAIGIEINPVGYVYARAKLAPARRDKVERRLDQLAERASRFADEASRLPRFFHRCFSRRVRRFLLAARTDLDWRYSATDRTVMAFLLVYLHGKAGAALSNQMRQTKSMSPQYAVRWWDDRGLDPPDIDPVVFLKKRVAWRYAKGTPGTRCGHVYLGDSAARLTSLVSHVESGGLARASLLFTSPPYYALTNYHYDQWLRLWLLGGPPNALRTGNGKRGKFEDRARYRNLLDRVFTAAARLLRRDATVYVRTDSREFTYRTTLDVLREVFPGKRLCEVDRPLLRPSQTRLFAEEGAAASSNGEVDLILRPGKQVRHR